MKSLRLAALALVTALGLAACGDAPPPADPAAPANETAAPVTEPPPSQ